MSAKEMENTILKLEAERKFMNSELDCLYEDLKSNSIIFIKEKIKNYIENKVKNNPDITIKIGIEALKDIKEKMNLLMSNVDDILPLCFEKIGVNKHKNIKIFEGDRINQKYNIPNEIERLFASAMKELISPIGDILVEYEYIKIDSREWMLDYSQNNKIKYLYGFEYSDIIKKTMNEYAMKCQQIFENMWEIEKISKEKSKLEAEDLWNQA